MTRVVSAEEMRRFEQERFSDGRALSLDWMERAAGGVDELLLMRYPQQRVLAVCGGGNNAGDGFALLRLLMQRGIECAGVLLSQRETLKGDAKTNFLRALENGVRFYDAISPERIAQYDVLVDAMFGTGLSRNITGAYAEAITWMNASKKPIVAIDIPSGVDATSGAILGCAIQANETVTFQFYKRGQLLFPGRGCCGEMILHSLTQEPDLSGNVFLFQREDAANRLPKRPADAHKGKNGRALLCVGSFGYQGAALLSTAACLRAGAGLTSAAVPGAVKLGFAALPEAMATAVNNSEDWDEAGCDCAKQLLPQKNAVCIGCGVGTGNILPLIRATVASGIPMVLDADALNQIATTRELLTHLHKGVILTPHPMEMSRLTGEPMEAILADPIGISRRYAQTWNCVVLLKGATSCISDGETVYLNTSGNAGLAKGGSGDVLSGLITGLLAQGLGALDAACSGAFLLGAAADAALELLRERMLLSRDVIGVVEQTIERLN